MAQPFPGLEQHSVWRFIVHQCQPNISVAAGPRALQQVSRSGMERREGGGRGRERGEGEREREREREREPREREREREKERERYHIH